MQMYSQELEAEVTVDRSQINNTSLTAIDNLAEEIETYINEHNWINASFTPQERIGVDIQITLLSADDNFNFDAQVVFRSRRPIYNSTRQTALFFYNDENLSFNYTPNRSLVHDKLQYDPLTSFFDFYVYIILGYDFDSFEDLGGTLLFTEAQKIVSQAQSISAAGWERSGTNRRSRGQLVENLLSPAYEGLRSAIYQYHRQGLDQFISDPEQARKEVLQALQKIQESKQNTSVNLLFDTFFNTKYREIASIFEDAAPQVKEEAFNLLSEIDQSHLSSYRQLQ
ncbi:DUF4835 family protein [Aliifodinibius sp. 1BSP15-2V2]|uniref:DUF4835 family protein n=2 Tax=Fodinibius salsisoli TaxID=2820877 RepID=A0ABT3PJG8_9BACT|nr:DUF4835 family protein [Fodinibius salsisoli]